MFHFCDNTAEHNTSSIYFFVCSNAFNTGFVELPDGKVLSGSEWGNMLLWEGGLIKVEISKKGRKPCHVGMIEQFFMDEGELMTIGVDGFVKVWDFESIDNADTTEEGQLFEMDPMYELKVRK